MHIGNWFSRFLLKAVCLHSVSVFSLLYPQNFTRVCGATLVYGYLTFCYWTVRENAINNSCALLNN